MGYKLWGNQSFSSVEDYSAENKRIGNLSQFHFKETKFVNLYIKAIADCYAMPNSTNFVAMAPNIEKNSAITLAFDVYGTLIDTHGVVSKLQDIIGTQAKSFSQTWRDKQLEYSFRRGLMRQYQDFAVCIAQALDYSIAFHQVSLSSNQKQSLLESYRTLPIFSDVAQALSDLKTQGFRLYAFSNGSAETIEALLGCAGIEAYFLDIVSADEVKTFKPNPDIYTHFLDRSHAQAEQTWLISSNPFDVIGARSAGLCAAWIQRSPNMIFDPWEFEPTLTLAGLTGLAEPICSLTQNISEESSIDASG